MGTFFIVQELVCVTLLLVLSFFILIAVRKIDSKGLKMFGYMIAMLLWISVAAIVLNRACADSSYKGRMMYNKGMYKHHMMGKDKMMHKKGMSKGK